MKVLVKTICGSNLYGTAIESSDQDFKVIFLPDLQDMIRFKVNRIKAISTGDIHKKNGSQDVDIEFIEVRRFLELIEQGQTSALETIFTPDEFIIEKDPLWDEIRQQARHLFCKKTEHIIGYMNSQILKFERQQEKILILEQNIKALERIVNEFGDKVTLSDIDVDTVHLETFQTSDKDILTSKKLKTNLHTKTPIVKMLNKSLHPMLKKLQSSNENFDMKTIMHAIRIGQEGVEFLLSEKITLPRPNANVLLDIRNGKIDKKKAFEMAKNTVKALTTAKASTSLPDRGNFESFDSFVDELYCRHLEDCLHQSRSA